MNLISFFLIYDSFDFLFALNLKLKAKSDTKFLDQRDVTFLILD